MILVFSFTWFQIFPSAAFAQDEDLYSFDVEEFTKKTWEWKNVVTLSGSSKQLNQDAGIYPLKFPVQEQNQIQEWSLLWTMDHRWDWDWSRLYLIGEASITRSSMEGADDNSSFLREAYWQLSVFDPHSIEIGKRLLRWGKGYVYNPVALLERPKNPADPEASREGLWVNQIVLMPSVASFLDANSISLIYLPIRPDINQDYQSDLEFENIWGLKIYALSGTTDLDLYYTRWVESQETDWGLDFASNILSNFEIHGEYALDQSEEEYYNKSLLGIRYLTERDVTWTIEGFHDGSGWTKDESSQIYDTIKNGSDIAAKKALMQLQQKQIVNQNYTYVKASFKEPFNWLYFTPSVSVLKNMDDTSSNLITQIGYAPVDNWSFQVAWQKMIGEENTQYGESLVGDKVELKGSYSF